jgi:hypothetical protein
MIDTFQKLARSLHFCAMLVVSSQGKTHFRRECGEDLAGTSVRLNPAYLAGLFTCLTFCLTCMPPSARATIRNVQTYGAKGDGTTNDTAAINSAISALQPGDTLLFPCTANSTYLITAQLTISQTSGGVPLSNVTVDGSSCAIIRGTASGTGLIVIGGHGNGNPNYGPAVRFSTPANELATSFTTASPLGATAGDYVRLQQGGKDYSTDTAPGHDTGCDLTGCRGEVVKVASVSGNTITVTTALHDSYDPAVNDAVAQKILNPLIGITVQNITLDGNGTNTLGLELAGVAESTVSGVTARNVQGAAILGRGNFNVGWSDITVTGAGSEQCGSAAWFDSQGNLWVDGMSISNENQGAPGTGCLGDGAFGFELVGSANGTISNLTVDAALASGRPFKTTAARWNTFNSLTVKNSASPYNNGISLQYYSSHNTFCYCVVTNNGSGINNGNAGINTFGNFNQYNAFNHCTVSGNGNIQFYISGYDALALAQDSHNTVSGGTFTGSNSSVVVMGIQGDGTFISGATISGPGSFGIYLDASPRAANNACVNNNTFVANPGLASAISANGTNDLGSGNNYNNLSSNLTVGVCRPPLP